MLKSNTLVNNLCILQFCSNLKISIATWHIIFALKLDILLTYFLQIWEGILRNIISVFRKSLNRILIGLLHLLLPPYCIVTHHKMQDKYKNTEIQNPKYQIQDVFQNLCCSKCTFFSLPRQNNWIILKKYRVKSLLQGGQTWLGGAS